MATAKIFYNEAGITPTMTNEDGSYPASNLAIENQSIVAKSTGVTTKITWNLGGAVTVYGVAYFNTSFATATTVTWQTGTISATVDSSTNLTKAIDGYNIETSAKQYVAIEITMPAGVCQVGQVYIFCGNGDISDPICPGKITNTQELIETISENNINGHESKYIYNYYDSFSWDYTNMLWANVATLKTIAQSNYTCFLPYGADAGIYYGIYKQGSFVPLTSDTTVGDIHFSSNGHFIECPASIETLY